MKKITLMMTAAAIGALSMTAPAMAESQDSTAKQRQVPTHDAAKTKGKSGQLFNLIDMDNDGGLTLAEVTAFHAQNVERMFEKLDANTDDVLNGKEAPKVVKLMDFDDDNHVTRDEALSGRSARAEKMFEKLDADADGKVTSDEFRYGHLENLPLQSGAGVKPRYSNGGGKPRIQNRENEHKPAKAEMRPRSETHDAVKDRKKVK